MDRTTVTRICFGLAAVLTLGMVSTFPLPPESPHERSALAVVAGVFLLQVLATVVAPSKRLPARALIVTLGTLGLVAVVLHAGMLVKGSTREPPTLSLALATGLGAAMAAGAIVRFLVPARS